MSLSMFSDQKPRSQQVFICSTSTYEEGKHLWEKQIKFLKQSIFSNKLKKYLKSIILSFLKAIEPFYV